MKAFRVNNVQIEIPLEIPFGIFLIGFVCGVGSMLILSLLGGI
jgi:hypothetical protein